MGSCNPGDEGSCDRRNEQVSVDKSEVMKAIELNSGRISYISNSANAGFMKVIMDGKYTGYNQCTSCKSKLSLIKSQPGGGVEHNLMRHNMVVHSEKSSSKGSVAPLDYMMEKEDVIAAMYHEPERVEYEESGHDALSGFQKVYHEGKYTGYMKCMKCVGKVVLLKEKLKKDGTSYPGLFGVSNIMKHDSSLHSVKEECLKTDSDSDDSESSAKKTRRLAIQEFDKESLLNLTDKEIDRHIKELKITRLRTDIQEKQSRMRESEERTRHYRRIDSKFDKLVKIASDVLVGINRLNEIQEGVKK